jgi:hypothetical protein
MHNQLLLNDYFSKHWITGENRGITDPKEISKRIDANKWLLDVGCGNNPFKKLLKNVVGIDPAFNEADYKCTIEEYQPDILFDVATCLGSINFGSEDIIEFQINKVVDCLKTQSSIYWRLNPGRHDHDNQECLNIIFFPWTFEKLNYFAKKHNYVQTIEKIDEHPIRPRLYAEWHRSS